MGNALTTSNASEILPVESYIQDLGNNVESLGSTRFMKVARGRSEGYVNIYKVFITPEKDVSLNLEMHRNEVLRIRDALLKSPNCCLFRKIYSKNRSEILVRPSQKFTLSDRFSTRPFVNKEERLWYTYQLFRALKQCQKAKVCHGDIKSQNLIISSMNWVQLTDFASFKPCYITNDNFSSFTYFFDMCRKQVCNLAPERLLSKEEYDKGYLEGGDKWLFGSLTHHMDMFSAGCVIFEMLSEGRSPFSFGELCSYSALPHNEAASYLDKVLVNIPTNYRPLLKILLNQAPSLRMSANDVLENGILNFPTVLAHIFCYLNEFRPLEGLSQSNDALETNGICEPDDLIAKVSADKDFLWNMLDESVETRPFAVLFVSLITANLRVLKRAQSKIDAMQLLVKFASLCDTTVSTQRILPYLVYSLSDENNTVRVMALHSIVDLTAPLEPVTFEDSLIFIDYLLPEFLSIMEKRHRTPSHLVHALASNLGKIAETAYRFLTVGRSLRSEIDDECSGAENLSDIQQWEEESTVLAKSIAELFVSMCSSGDSVRQCVIQPKNLRLLHAFFTRIGNNEIILNHMITFLNSKSEWRLRAAFFDALPICVQRSSATLPLLEQGLNDYEELVIIRVLHCIYVLVAADFLNKVAIQQLFRNCFSFLAHPNPWIRIGVVNLLVLLDSKWELPDIFCLLSPATQDYFTFNSFMRFNNKVVIYNSLQPAIPRNVWKAVMMNLTINDTEELRYKIGKLCSEGVAILLNAPWFNKYISKNDADNKDLMKKLASFDLEKMLNSKRSDAMGDHMTKQRGLIDLSSHDCCNVVKRSHDFKKSLSHAADSRDAIGSSALGDSRDISISFRTSAYGSQLQELLNYKRDIFNTFRSSKSNDWKASAQLTSQIKGNLITNLHEHRGPITQLAVSRTQEHFASASMDGTVKLWNMRMVTGECYGAVRSQTTYQLPNQPVINSIAWFGDNLVMASKDRHIVWTSGTADIREKSKVLLPEEEGEAVQIVSDSQLLFVRTHHSVIYCLDQRIGRSNGPLKKHEAWRRDIDKTEGLVTSFCLDPWHSNWFVVGCTSRTLSLWDIRFQMKLHQRALRSDSGQIPLKLWSNPKSSPQAPEVFAQFDAFGEVSTYDMSQRLSDRNRVLWPSLTKPLQYDKASIPGDICKYTYMSSNDDFRNQTSALCVCDKTGTVFTGDSRGALRKWNLFNAYGCEYLSGPRLVEGVPYKMVYRSINSSDKNPSVIYESRVPLEKIQLRPPPIDSKPSSMHRTPIADMACIGSDYLLSASSDGIIKVWK